MITDQKVDFAEISRSGIDPATIMSTDKAGLPLSRFEDDEWDYSFQQGALLNFSSWHEGEQDELFYELKLQMKSIFFVLIATPEARFRERFKTHPNYLAVLRKMAKLAHRSGCSFANASNNSFFQAAIRQSIANTVGDPVRISGNSAPSLLKKIRYVETRPDTASVLGISLFSPEDYEHVLTLLSKSNKDRTSERTPLIPSNIYAGLIDSLSKEITYIEPYLDAIRSFFDRYYSDLEYFCFSYNTYKSKRRNMIEKTKIWGNEFPHDVDKPHPKKFQSRDESKKESGLSDVFDTRCNQVSYKGLWLYLTELQKACSLTCLVFSGMRMHELEVMPYNCIERVSVKGFGEVIALKTHTSKLNQGEYSKPMLWVTNELTARAVHIAQVIADCFAMHMNGTANLPDKSKMPLWFSLRPTAQKRLIHYDYPTRTMDGLSTWKPLSNLLVDQEAIDELETFDAFRDWRLKVGQAWPFANHQFRRALVVYASRSGMVSLPSLGSQLKHLSLMMTALYAENSSFAENFILDDEGNIPESHGVVREFREERLFNMSLSFHENVIKAKSKLTGGTGKFIQKDKERGRLPKVMSSRKETEKGMREGQLSYIDTVVGGCMRKEVCESYGVDDVVPCVFGCPDSIIGGDGGKKLKAYAEDLEWGLEELDKGSPAYRTTESELRKIKVKLLEEEGIEL